MATPDRGGRFTMRSRSLLVELELLTMPKRSPQLLVAAPQRLVAPTSVNGGVQS